MTWGTDFRTDIFLSRQSFGSKGDIKMRLDELDKTIQGIEAQIKMHASATPKDILPEDWKEDPINWFDIRLNELLENYREAVVERFKVDLYGDYIEENNIDLMKKTETDDLPF